jgi:hypothetical protein
LAGGFPPNPRANRRSAGADCPMVAVPALFGLAFTLAPHLQLINHRGCFSPFAGI